jgi:hypothetical protein
MPASTNGNARSSPATTPSAWWLCWHGSRTPARARYHVIEHRRRNDFLSHRREARDSDRQRLVAAFWCAHSYSWLLARSVEPRVFAIALLYEVSGRLLSACRRLAVEHPAALLVLLDGDLSLCEATVQDPEGIPASRVVTSTDSFTQQPNDSKYDQPPEEGHPEHHHNHPTGPDVAVVHSPGVGEREE